MTTPKKKHLIELMIGAGVKWPDGAEYAAQDGDDSCVYFYSVTPKKSELSDRYWITKGVSHLGRKKLSCLCSNWHQTIVTREQYEDALAGANPEVQHEACESDDIPAVDQVEWHNPPSIEQLTADYHAKAAEADRLQAVADEAIKAADEALLALEKAGELLGLVISIDTKPKQAAQQCSRAEWKIGDKCIVSESPCAQSLIGKECVITNIDSGDGNLPYRVEFINGDNYWVRDISRP